MGNAVRRAITKPMRSFNIENRAERAIAKDKPVQAPRHKVKGPIVPEEVQKEIRSKILERSDMLENRLRDVKVVSEGVNPEIRRVQENLPQNRGVPSQTVYGFIEPKSVPKGKLTLGQVLELLSKHCNNPKAYKAEEAAKEYGLELRDAELLIEYYLPLTLIDPTNAKDMAKLGMKTKQEYLKEVKNY